MAILGSILKKAIELRGKLPASRKTALKKQLLTLQQLMKKAEFTAFGEHYQFSKKLKDLYIKFFDLKKITFNQKRNVKMYGFDVEMFVEDSSDIHGISGGVYSLMNDKWIKKPSRESSKVSNEEIIKNSKKWMRLIDNLIKHIEGEDIDTIRSSVKVLKDKIKKYRESGLNKGGELGLENLVYKMLRRNGYIDKIFDIPVEVIDKKLSINEVTLGKPLEKMVVTSPFGIIRDKLGSKPHPGVDLGVPTGTELFAIADGEVLVAEIRNDACGGTLKIKHEDGFVSRFCHLSRIDVDKGERVKQGQKIEFAPDAGYSFLNPGERLNYQLTIPFQALRGRLPAGSATLSASLINYPQLRAEMPLEIVP